MSSWSRTFHMYEMSEQRLRVFKERKGTMWQAFLHVLSFNVKLENTKYRLPLSTTKYELE